MASNTRIPQTELTGIYGAMIKRMTRKMVGDVPDAVGVMWHNRKVLTGDPYVTHRSLLFTVA